MSVTHTHSHEADTYTTRQPLIDHMVTVHLVSPTHFRDKETLEEVRAVHDAQHDPRWTPRSGDDRRAWDHPQHYGGADNPYEAIKVIEAWELDFCLGNTVKYVSRAGKKDPAKEIEDLEKARWYLDRRIQQLRGV